MTTPAHGRAMELALRHYEAGNLQLGIALSEVAEETRWFTISAETARLLSFAELDFLLRGTVPLEI